MCVPHSQTSADLVWYSEEVFYSLLEVSAHCSVTDCSPVELDHTTIHPGETIALEEGEEERREGGRREGGRGRWKQNG